MLWSILIAVGVIAVVALFLGPRVSLDFEWRVPKVPSALTELDAYLALSEKQFSDLKPGTEKQLVWLEPSSPQKSEWAVVYLHGFSASRQEVAPLCDLLANELGANLFYQRLTGHGLSSDRLADGDLQAWMDDAAEALAIGRQIGDRVLLVGTSTGATLALLASLEAGQFAPDALVLISPNFGPGHWAADLALWPSSPVWAPLLFGKTWRWNPLNEDHRRFWTCDYPQLANLRMMAVVARGRSAPLEKLDIPALFFYSDKDAIVRPDRIRDRFAVLASPHKQLIEIDPAGDPRSHVLAGRILAPANTQKLLVLSRDFVRSIPLRPKLSGFSAND